MQFNKNILFSLVFILFSQITNAQIQHIEPLNWWVGLKNPNLQLLVNGENVAELSPKINYQGVSLKKVTKGDSKNYLFLDLVIAKNTKAGKFQIDLYKSNKKVYSQDYELLNRETDPKNIKGFNSADVIYLITPDRFSNGDPKNDIVDGMRENKVDRKNEGGRHGGDIRGIINHLDYIHDMGFTAIWPTPVLENNMNDYSYHGYAITNHYKVDPRMGLISDYKELSKKAKEKGIKLIYDGVINHTGSYYWWMQDLPFKNWINYPDSIQITSHRRTVNEDMYASIADKETMTKGWFVPTMPDMNGENPFMANYLIQNTIWWIETLQLGGLRQDTYCYSNKDFSKKWSCSVMDEYPNFSMVGEEWSYNPLITSYWQRGKVNKDGYTSCLSTSMDFPLQQALITALKEKEGTSVDKGFLRIYESLANDFVYANPNDIMIFGDNHDMDRIFTQLNEDAELTKMALTFLMTTRGIPQIYYGTEILADNAPNFNNHGFIRSDFPGGWDGDQVNAFTGKNLTPKQLDMQNYLKKLMNYRKSSAVLSKGKLLHFFPIDDIYVYFRHLNYNIIMVVLNRNEQSKMLDTKRFSEILKNKVIAKDIITSEEQQLVNPLNLKGKSATIFEIK